MATSFPTSLDALTNPTGANTLASPDHAGQHSDANDAIEALEAKVGVDSSAVVTSLDYKVAQKIDKTLVDAKGDLIVASAADTVGRLAVGATNGHVLTVASAETLGVKWAAAAGMTELDTQTFTSSTTYTLSASAKIVIAEVIGAGGGGGGGSRQTTTAGGGGGGNGCQLMSYTLVVGSDISSGSVTVTIGAGGTGGAGATVVANNGVAGVAGGSSTFGSFSCPGAFGGPEGLAANTNQTVRMGLQTKIFLSTAASNVFGTGGYNLAQPGRKGYQGGGGGGYGARIFSSTAEVGSNGGSSETSLTSALSTASNTYIANNSGGGAGGATSTVGAAGTSRAGGGGGGSSTTTTGGAGGAGGAGGGGGGGGGSSSAAAGGAGGAGGAGQIKIWVFG